MIDWESLKDLPSLRMRTFFEKYLDNIFKDINKSGSIDVKPDKNENFISNHLTIMTA